MKCICVPRTAAAQARLGYDEATPDELVEWHFDYDTFELLWKAHVFYSINKLTGSSIDDFEHEEIKEIEKLKMILDSKILDKKRYKRNVHPLIDNLQNLFIAAVDFQTGVFFFF